jgi:hypothetical protein
MGGLFKTIRQLNLYMAQKQYHGSEIHTFLWFSSSCFNCYVMQSCAYPAYQLSFEDFYGLTQVFMLLLNDHRIHFLRVDVHLFLFFCQIFSTTLG